MKISDGYIVPVKGDYLKRFGNEEILKKYNINYLEGIKG